MQRTTAEPDGSTRNAWRDIFANPNHTRQTSACVAAAIDLADDLTRHSRAADARDDSAPHRGGPLWTYIAAAIYRVLAGADAYRAVDLPGRVVADGAQIRTWLQAPDPRSATGQTVAYGLDIHDDLLRDDELRPARLARLIHAAQAAGILRGHHLWVELWHVADDAGDLIGHRIAVHRDGVTLTSRHLDATDLADHSLTGVAAATAVLTRTAQIATDILTKADAARTGTLGDERDRTATPDPGRPWVKGFPISTRAAPHAAERGAAAPAGPPPPAPGGHGHHR